MYGINDKDKCRIEFHEITENAVKYVRDSIGNRMKDEYMNWYKDVQIAQQTLQSERFDSIINFLMTGEDNLIFNSSNFKIQNDYNEELMNVFNCIKDEIKFNKSSRKSKK